MLELPLPVLLSQYGTMVQLLLPASAANHNKLNKMGHLPLHTCRQLKTLALSGFQRSTNDLPYTSDLYFSECLTTI